MTIGFALSEARLASNLSIEEAAWRTRIRPEYLRALENDDLDALGEGAFVRGYLISYARFLGIDQDGILGAYERDYEQPGSPIEHLDRQVRIAKRPRRPRWLLAAVLAGAALIAVSAVGLVHGPGERPVGQAALPVLPGSRLAQPQPASRSHDERGVYAGQAQTQNAPIAVTVAAAARCWLQITVDRVVVFAGVLDAGQQRTFTATDGLVVDLGNAGAASLTFNGATVPLHASGVWHGTFSPHGLTA